MIANWEVLLRLFAAAVLGGLVGIERERRHTWTAGLRTHMLVSVGSCLFMLASAHAFTEVLGPHVVLDPSRIAAQVASGIGFLGAGAILLRKDFIRGLTTAASIWTVAAIGLACGGGMYAAGLATTVLSLLILAGMRPIERRFFPHVVVHRVLIRTDAERDALSELRVLAQSNGLKLMDFKMQQDKHGSEVRFDLTLQGDLPKLLDLVEAVRQTDGNHPGAHPMKVEAISGRLPEPS